MPHQKELMYSYLIILSICSSAGLQCWQTLFDNFAVNVVGLDGYHIGILQSVREILGFLATFLSYQAMFILFGCMIIICSIWAFTKNPMKIGMLTQMILPQVLPSVLPSTILRQWFCRLSAGCCGW